MTPSALIRRPVSTSRRHGVTLTDLCVLLAIGAIFLAIALPALRQRLNADRDVIKCAANLRQLALAGIIYGNQSTRNSGKFPRTYFDPSAPATVYTGRDVTEAFSLSHDPRVPKANDTTAAFYHLLKSSDVTPEVFICPASDAVPLTGDIQQKSNFPGPENLSYSYNTPYARGAAIQVGWKFDTTLAPDYPYAADINPGDTAGGGPTQVSYTDPPDKLIAANSPNHYFAGQNVVYVDGHTEWVETPFCGAPVRDQNYRDNIYASAKDIDRATGKGGVILELAQERTDSVMLPTIQHTTAGATVTLALRKPGDNPSGMMLYVAIGVGVLLLAAAVLIVVMSMRKKPQPIAAQPLSGPPPGEYGGHPPHQP